MKQDPNTIKMKTFGGILTRIVILVTIIVLVTNTPSVKGQDVWVVGIDQYYPPHEYWDNGTARGFNVDVLNAVAAKMGKTIQWVPLVWSYAEAALTNGTVDSLVMSITEERKTKFDFSTPFLNLTLRIFVRMDTTGITNIRDLTGHTVAVEEDDVAHTIIVQQVPDATIVPVDTQEEAIKLVSKGEVTAAFCNEYAGSYAILSNNISNVKKIGDPVTIGQRAIAVAKGNTVLLNDINNALSDIFESGEYNDIFERWFGSYVMAGASANVVVRNIIFILIIAGLVTLGLITWNWYLHNRVRQITERLTLLIDIFRHDLRNIGQTILVALQLIEMDPNITHESREILETAFTALDKSQQLTNDFSTIEALTAGRIPTKSMLFAKVMDEAIQRAVNMSDDLNIRIEYGHSDETHIRGCDVLPDAISRVITVLTKGVSLAQNHCDVIIRTRESRIYVHIYIGADTQTTPESYQTLLKRYLGSKNYGIGLDLSLVHATITSCRGTIEVTGGDVFGGQTNTVLHIVLRRVPPV